MNPPTGASPIREVGLGNFDSEVLKANLPVLVEFFAPWSQPCRVLDPVLQEVAELVRGKVKILKVNADENPELSLWYEIQSIPMLLCFMDGTLRGRIVGTATRDAIIARLQAACGLPENGKSKPAASREQFDEREV
jgi:thioredoxin 1